MRGAGSAAASTAETHIQDKVMAKRNERLMAQRAKESKSDQEFRSAESEKTRTHQKEVAELDRKSREKMAGMRHGDNKLSEYGRIIRDLKAFGDQTPEEAHGHALKFIQYSKAKDPSDIIRARAELLQQADIDSDGMSVEDAYKQAKQEYRESLNAAKEILSEKSAPAKPGPSKKTEVSEGGEKKVAPQKAIDYLKKNPDLADKFKSHYGYLPEGF